MPYQNVETSTITLPSFSTTTNQDYNLSRLANTNPAFGISIQATYTFGTATSVILKIQASNDGVNFADVSGSSVTVTATGVTIWDAGNPNYKIIRVNIVPTGGTVAVVLIANSVNLS